MCDGRVACGRSGEFRRNGFRGQRGRLVLVGRLPVREGPALGRPEFITIYSTKNYPARVGRILDRETDRKPDAGARFEWPLLIVLLQSQ